MFTQDDNLPMTSSPNTDDQNQGVTKPIVGSVNDPQLTADLPPVVEPPAQSEGGYVNSYSPPPASDNQTPTQQAPFEEDQVSQVDQDMSPSADVETTTELHSAPDSPDDSAKALSELEELMKKIQSEKNENLQKPTTQAQDLSGQVEQASTVSDVHAASPLTDHLPSTDPTDLPDTQASPMPMASKMTMPGNQSSQDNLSEDLADQNIFFLLGVEDGSVEEQEQFLDELQQTVWDDFIQKDLDLLITSQEKIKADEILNNAGLEELEKQEQLLEYLDGLIPDLEDIMLEKALSLKADLFKERIASYKEQFDQDQEKLAKLDEALRLLDQNKWHSAGEILNKMS